MDVSTLQSYSRGREYAKSVERAKYWVVRDTCLLIWLGGLVVAAIAVPSYLKGLNDGDQLHAWSETVVAK